MPAEPAARAVDKARPAAAAPPVLRKRLRPIEWEFIFQSTFRDRGVSKRHPATWGSGIPCRARGPG